jgi:D-alanyl-D-alanine dipeptidase
MRTKAILTTCLSLWIGNAAIAANNTAPACWADTAVPKEIASNVLYQPIADQAVKSILIQDSEEPLVDLNEINNPRMKPLASLSPNYPNTYAGYAKVRQGLYQGLVAMLNHLPDGIGIAYFEGFRPLQKQKEYFDNKLKETLLTIKDKELAYQEASKSVSPFIENTPVHCTGAAIDMTLFKTVDGKPQLLDMGEFDTIYGVNPQQETFSENTTQEQRTNRLLLLKAATQAGLVNYGYEWWHYSFGDKAWAYVKGERAAIYGLAVSKDDPILSITKDSYLKQF